MRLRNVLSLGNSAQHRGSFVAAYAASSSGAESLRIDEYPTLRQHESFYCCRLVISLRVPIPARD